MPSNHLMLCHLLLLLPSIFPRIRVSSNESALLVRWSQYWSFSFTISPSNEYSVLLSFGIDLFDLLAVQWTQEFSPALQFKSINSSVFSILYGPILLSTQDYWKKKTYGFLTMWTFVSKVMSLLLKTWSGFINFLHLPT